MKLTPVKALLLGLGFTFVVAVALAAHPVYVEMYQNKDSSFCLFDSDGAEVRSDNAWGCAIDLGVVAVRHLYWLVLSLTLCGAVFALVVVVIALTCGLRKKRRGTG